MCHRLFVLSCSDALHRIRVVSVLRFIRADNAGLLSARAGLRGLFIDIVYNFFPLSFNYRKISFGRVMAVFHSGRFRNLFRGRINDRVVDIYAADNALEHLLCDISGAQDGRLFIRQIDNTGFQTDTDLSAVDDHLNAPVQVLPAVLRHCGRGSSGTVCRWRRYKTAAGFNQGFRDFIAGKAHSDCFQTAGRLIWHSAALVKDHRHRSRPESVRKPARFLRHFAYNLIQVFYSADMDNQRIV